MNLTAFTGKFGIPNGWERAVSFWCGVPRWQFTSWCEIGPQVLEIASRSFNSLGAIFELENMVGPYFPVHTVDALAAQEQANS